MFDLFTTLNMAFLGQALYAITKTGVADRLARAPATVADAAVDCGVDATVLQQTLFALAAYGFVLVDDTGNYRLAPKARGLATNEEPRLRELTLIWGEQLYPVCGKLDIMLKTGQPAFAHHFGTPIWEHYRKVRGDGERFENFMDAVTDWQGPLVANALDCSGIHSLVDVGGARGSLTIPLLLRNPHLTATIFDQPHHATYAGKRLAAAGLANRASFVGGDFLRDVPANADAYVVKHALHDWADVDVVRILSNIARAMRPDSRLVIVEGLVDENPRSGGLLKLRNLEQMAWTGGRVRTQLDWETLLQSASLQLDKVETVPEPRMIDGKLLFASRTLPG